MCRLTKKFCKSLHISKRDMVYKKILRIRSFAEVLTLQKQKRNIAIQTFHQYLDTHDGYNTKTSF